VNETIVVIETADGLPTEGSLGALAMAKRLGEDVRAVCLGAGSCADPGGLGRYGATRVVVLDHPELAPGLPQPAAAALARYLAEQPGENVLFASSVLTLDVAADLAVRSGGGLNWDLVGIEQDGDRLVGTRLIANDALRVTVGWRTLPRLALLRPGSSDPTESEDRAQVETVPVMLEDAALRARVVEHRPIQPAAEGGLTETDVVVAGGRGLGAADNFALLEELARVLGGEVGATRAVVEAGWYPREAQIGQTGTTVSPSLYLGCGVSGAIHHKVGMQRSGTIVAINTDRDAPIFDLCHLAVVGDALAILPELIAVLRDADASDSEVGGPLE
jgi:electron transfer flavoprotein alpha subunit